MTSTARPTRQVRLSFDVGGAVPGSDEQREFRASLSSLVVLDGGRTLLLGGDETVRIEPSIERLSLQPDGSYAEHRSFAVNDYIDLPDTSRDEGRVGEIDIEGMDEHEGYLWLTGSHSSNRKRPHSGKPMAAQIEQLATVRRGKNRSLVARIPLAHDAAGARLEKKHEGRRAARLRRGWLKNLRSDPHLGLFLTGFEGDRDHVVPGKDNGFDIEGLSAMTRADGTTRLLLGLRGPVLRGFAIVLELCPIDGAKGRLELAPVHGGSRCYRKHFLDLGGLGVRDLGWFGEDLWILAGPTVALDGPVAVFRWRAPFADPASSDTLTRLDGERLSRELVLPFGEGDDHAEAFALLSGEVEGSASLLVVYDSPSPERLDGSTAVRADLFQV
ncbi:MAG TPA: DUF3616 domain-containing protein [Polyangiaceae bacterium]|nr:DUF3616 domain-containing protein [Polyangiaceae bacterium]